MKDLLLGLVFTALGITTMVMSRDFQPVSGLQYGANLFPTLIGAGMTIGGILLSISASRQCFASAAGQTTLDLPSIAAVVPVLIVVGYILFSDVLGTTLCLAIGMLLLFLTRGVRPLPAIGISVVSALVISFAFTRLLAVPLPSGPLNF
ncbi:tripartite tricarboxylate transporter TctB family protein [Pokkaliibacter sp. CJK22405]|uniref:tripartite tricarboxylate transporter TctB family protein n=1 Tax=Pokkaliibacter sp. CJK22405 TaxID=3384615 RepID=UPI003984CB87